MARRQDNNKRKDKWTALVRRAGLWGSGSTGKLLKTQKRRSQLQWYIYIYIYKYALKIGPRN